MIADIIHLVNRGQGLSLSRQRFNALAEQSRTRGPRTALAIDWMGMLLLAAVPMESVEQRRLSVIEAEAE